MGSSVAERSVGAVEAARRERAAVRAHPVEARSWRGRAQAEGAMKFMAMKIDPCGMPRAWGIAKTREEASQEANSQLAAYRVRKRENGDPLADAKFTEMVKVLP
jgi:hypothetical protein